MEAKFDGVKINFLGGTFTKGKDAEIARLEGLISELSAGLTLANAQINALVNAVTPMASEIAGKASASAVGVLNMRVGRIEGDADRFRADGIMRVHAADAAGNHAMSPSAITAPQTATDLADDLRAGLEKLAAWLRDGIALDDKITAKAETVTQLSAGLPPVVGPELIVLPMDLWRLSVENGVILLGAWGTVSTDDLYLRHWVKLETSGLSDDLPRLHDLECRLVDVVDPHSA